MERKVTMANFNQESVLSVHHWTDNLFSFTTTRDPSFRFRNGEFVMIGLEIGDKPLMTVAERTFLLGLVVHAVGTPPAGTDA